MKILVPLLCCLLCLSSDLSAQEVSIDPTGETQRVSAVSITRSYFELAIAGDLDGIAQLVGKYPCESTFGSESDFGCSKTNSMQKFENTIARTKIPEIVRKTEVSIEMIDLSAISGNEAKVQFQLRSTKEPEKLMKGFAFLFLDSNGKWKVYNIDLV